MIAVMMRVSALASNPAQTAAVLADAETAIVVLLRCDAMSPRLTCGSSGLVRRTNRTAVIGRPSLEGRRVQAEQAG